jgi:hypothetical protein
LVNIATTPSKSWIPLVARRVDELPQPCPRFSGHVHVAVAVNVQVHVHDQVNVNAAVLM